MVVSGSQDATAYIWDLRSASPVSAIPSPSQGILIAVDVNGIYNYSDLRFSFKIICFCEDWNGKK